MIKGILGWTEKYLKKLLLSITLISSLQMVGGRR